MKPVTKLVRELAFVLIASLGVLATEAEADATERTRIIIDADTANEIDDFYAIVRALLAPEFQVEGLCSATFGRNPPAKNIRASQQFNEEILAHLGLSETVPAPIGSATPMPDKNTPADSPAARHIIECAHAGGPDNKLWVIATGQCTNLASALLIDPTIKDKVVFAFIDGDFKNGRWGPGIYNWKNDIHAVQAIFESDVEYFHMPAPSVSGQLKMAKDEAEKHLKGRGGIHDYLLNRWNTFRPERKLWTMWDIALVEAILWPDMATAKPTGAPIVHGVRKVEQFPNNPRRVTVWVDIDEKRMLDDFWRVLDQYATENDEKAHRDRQSLQGT
jgi:inosine-uridine nucleoside N-ribohydrolase